LHKEKRVWGSERIGKKFVLVFGVFMRAQYQRTLKGEWTEAASRCSLAVRINLRNIYRVDHVSHILSFKCCAAHSLNRCAGANTLDHTHT